MRFSEPALAEFADDSQYRFNLRTPQRGVTGNDHARPEDRPAGGNYAGPAGAAAPADVAEETRRMQLTGSRTIAAPPETVWRAVNDVDILRRSLPGCERLVRLADDQFAATVTARLGPMTATFAGTLRLADIDPPHGCRIEGEGESAAAGAVRGNAVIRLASDGDGTRLDYEVEARVGDTLAQLGGTLVDDAARETADEFFARFSALVAPSPEPTGPAVAPEPVRRPGLAVGVWVPALIAMVFGMLVVVARL